MISIGMISNIVITVTITISNAIIIIIIVTITMMQASKGSQNTTGLIFQHKPHLSPRRVSRAHGRASS